MSPLFKKLNLASHTEILVLHAPESFETELEPLVDVTVHREADALDEISFSLAFVTRKAEIDEIVSVVAPRAPGDPVVWFAYPKGSSKRYSCDFHRDTGWEALGAHGFEGVRQVAIDEDWSALRFRRVEHIRSMQRDPKRAMTAAGRRKTAKG